MLSSKLTSNMPEGTVFLLIDGNLNLLIGRISLPENENFRTKKKKKKVSDNTKLCQRTEFSKDLAGIITLFNMAKSVLRRKHQDVENAEAGFGFKSQLLGRVGNPGLSMC